MLQRNFLSSIGLVPICIVLLALPVRGASKEVSAQAPVQSQALQQKGSSPVTGLAELDSVTANQATVPVGQDSARNEMVLSNDLFYPSLVRELYQSTGKASLWLDGEVNAQLLMQLDMLRLAGFSPLFAQRIDKLERLFQQQEFTAYDHLATDTVLAYISYVNSVADKGQTWFFTEGLYQALPPPSQSEIEQLANAFSNGSELAFILQLASPMLRQPEFYQVYMDMLAKAQLEVDIYHQQGLKRKGDVFTESQYLMLIDRLHNSGIQVLENSVQQFDLALEQGVREFQRLYGLSADGVIGPNTIEWLNKTSQDKLQILALNSERSRLWPVQRENLVLVNVPSFQLEYWDEGEARFESRVIVGKFTRQTPIFVIHMDSLIVNPTWNVPRKIMVQDIIPKVKRDPGYLFAQQFEVLEGWHSQAKIDPTRINWQRVNAKHFPYRMRQRAGKFNALGQYKFNTPNDQAIFLHDTPSKHLFDKSSRAFSSGCVRVEHAEQFAQVLLEEQGKSINSLNTKRSNKAISFKRRIPVHVIYQTAWLEDGQVHFRNDVYDYDAPKQTVSETSFSKN